MTKIALLRCSSNAEACPLTSCFRALGSQEQGFAAYDQADLMGVFTLPKDNVKALALVKILKAKGAEAIHVVTCAFAHKQGKAWHLGNGREEGRDALYADMARATGLPVVKGSAHLPAGYAPERFEP